MRCIYTKEKEEGETGGQDRAGRIRSRGQCLCRGACELGSDGCCERRRWKEYDEDRKKEAKVTKEGKKEGKTKGKELDGRR